MTLDKAIELLKVANEGWPVGDDSEDYYKALDLGKEALKAWKERRENYPMLKTYMLPGETEK